MTKPHEKAQGCNLRKTHPIGPIKFCPGLHCFELCVEISKEEIAHGLDHIKGPYRAIRTYEKGRSRACLICDQRIARPSTRWNSFAGMLAFHIKVKHRDVWDKYKLGEIRLQDLFYFKD